MDERRDPQRNAPDEGELLAAYLDADTDDLATARIERRLREDAQVAARLDALARTRARLQRLDEVAPPPELRQRLDARLRAERAAVDDTTGRAPSKTVHADSADRQRRRWFAPLAAAAALMFAAAIGGAALFDLLPQTTSGGESAGTSPETSGDAAAPMAAPDSAREDAGAEEAEEADDAEELDEQTRAADGAMIPPVTADTQIAARLRRRVPQGDDPAAQEAELRANAGLGTDQLCLTGVEADAVDLVERDGRPLLATLERREAGSQVTLFDPVTCATVRTFSD